jgi:glycerate 2-kinase
MTLRQLREDLGRIRDAALVAIDPRVLMQRAQARGTLDSIRETTFTVVAVGKAAWPMAAALARMSLGPVRGGVVAGPRIGDETLPPELEWFQATHPLPNHQSVAAARRSLALAEAVDNSGVLVVLLSGGASSMLAYPVPAITLDDKIATARLLMEGGVAIDGLNCVRKHLSLVKGGRLGALASRSFTLAISDVHGPIPDDPSVIGSGPTVPDSTTFGDAQRVIAEAGVQVRPAVAAYLERGARDQEPETVKPGDERLAHARFEVIGSRRDAVEAAWRAAERAGYRVEVVEEATHGEARVAGQHFLNIGGRLASQSGRPLCVLGSGETTVRVTGGGVGGRNQEFALGAASAITEFEGAALLASIGTDGADGPTEAAGAVVDSSTLDRAAHVGLEWISSLERNDAYHFFEPLGDLIVTGPTGTNVGDLHVLLLG